MKQRILFSLFISLIFIGTGFGQSIIINEIHYNSAPNADTEDWVEIYNRSAASVIISGWILKDSNDANQFVIPGNTFLDAGAYLVIYRDEIDFSAVHPNVGNKLGPFDFNFSNGGELIRLFNAASVLIDQVEYDDEGDWPTEPDGNGPTLELRDPNSDNSLASSWGVSSGFGTPGAQNSITVSNEEETFNQTTFRLNQNYPNPFNPSTNITYSISKPGNVSLEVFDLLGQRVAVLVNQVHSVGEYDVDFDASNLTSGIYIYRITQSGQTLTRRMTLIK